MFLNLPAGRTLRRTAIAAAAFLLLLASTQFASAVEGIGSNGVQQISALISPKAPRHSTQPSQKPLFPFSLEHIAQQPPDPKSPKSSSADDPSTRLSLVSSSWDGMASDFSTEPPDPHGAAGPVGIIQVINTRIAYFDKFGVQIWGPVPLDGMFASVGNSNFSFDPRALYDPGSGRFYVVVIEQDTSNEESYLNIAVSKTSDPRSSSAADWFLYRFRNTSQSGTTRFWGDYPGFGFDSQAIYTTVNHYSFANVGANGFLERRVLLALGDHHYR